ncbi:MAG: early nodulin 20 (N-20) [Lachnospiraceae bacterium]|nr:early nodulin 20 (N-20) [Lachnospiraceae bacterium]
MADTIFLSKPLKINGKNVTDLTYDTNEITVEQFNQADIMSHEKATKSGRVSSLVAETDVTFALYLGFFAIIAVNPDIDIMDLERITGRDLWKIAQIGRLFFSTSAEEGEEEENEDSEADNSEEPAETMRESSM